ncbi:MAG: hypothetical protein AVDCRST_MAG86-1575 [uncultured Truepera sp.]|uniref:Uncharacterized protein n=1 Tax=uncultured Truepera sp. TaxID=543023 RepID=A0A6J4V6M2_9DEIN|nr:MAG: hypothetical protein AVDCRST_MAG86-1575 [uncultured Truepera sp.]
MQQELGRTTFGQVGIQKRDKDLWSLGVLPVMMVGAVSGIVGLYWDVAWHVDKGRDSFFTPPHNFLYGAIAIVLLMSVVALVRDRRDTPLHLPIGRLRLHPGVLIVAVGAALELFFAPADELWHRLFGPDATLWAPMHLVGLTGLTLAAFGSLVSAWVETRLATEPARKRLFALVTLFFAAILLAWSAVLMAEFEFYIQVFPTFWHPLLLTGLPAFTLVLMARLRPLPWAATLTALGFGALRLLLAVFLMGTSALDLAGDTRPLIPVFILAGLAADLLVSRLPAWAVGLAVGATSLLTNWFLVGTVGLMSWHRGALLVGVPLGLLLACVLGVLGSLAAKALAPKPEART